MLFLFLLLCPYLKVFGTLDFNGNVNILLPKLDSVISSSASYDSKKEMHIQTLRHNLSNVKDNKTAFEITYKLYEEYRSYQYDSAFVYANRLQQLARKLSSTELEVKAACAKVFCLCSAGFYKEAFDTFKDINNVSHCDTKAKELYYETAVRLYYDAADYNGKQPYFAYYVKEGNCYTDSLLHYISRDSYGWWMAVARRQMKQNEYQKSIRSFGKALSHKDLDLHNRAIALSSIAWCYLNLEESNKSANAMIMAAICDVKASTKETTALRMLSEWLYKNGEKQKATRYGQEALKVASFYGARQRVLQVGNVLPFIEKDVREGIVSQRNTLLVFTSICVVLICIIAYLLGLAVRHSKKLRQANKIVKDTNALLEKTNEELQESNKIKVEYVGSTLYSNAVYVDEIQNIFKIIQRKIAANQFDDLRRMMKESVLKEKRGNLFANFDETFLHIFPTFIEEYNRLFPKEAQVAIKPGEPLTAEMRIFALIRLGINDTERIAKFLNKSVNTVHTYKSRVKNKSLIKNEEFESYIMKIGTIR